MTDDPQSLLHRVPDEYTINVLALLLDARSRLPDAATARRNRDRLAAVASDPTPLQVVDDSTGVVTKANATQLIAVGDGTSSDAALARAAVEYLSQVTQMPLNSFLGPSGWPATRTPPPRDSTP